LGEHVVKPKFFYYSGEQSQHEIYFINGDKNEVSTVLHNPASKSGGTDGFTNPSWRSQVRRGENASTSFLGTDYPHDAPWGSIGYKSQRNNLPYNDTDDFEVKGYFPASWPALSSSSPALAECTNRAIRKFLEACTNARSSVELGQDIGEIKQTIEGIRHPMDSMRKLILGHFSRLKTAKRRYRNKTPSLKKALADSYLEFKFGWNPLASDVADAWVGLTSSARMTPTVPVEGHASATYNGSDSYRTLYSICTQNLVVHSKYSVKYKGAIRVRLTEKGFVPFPEVLRLNSVQDFVTTAWDLVPYSFLVDYFTNIGDIINALTFPFGSLTWSQVTIHNETVNRYSHIDNGVNPTSGTIVNRSVSVPNYEFKVKSVQRAAVNPSDLVPTFRLSLPVSSKPWENIAALITANTKKLVPFFNIKELRSVYTD
jgi:hypothetical protein